jgi:hypothetical protein
MVTQDCHIAKYKSTAKYCIAPITRASSALPFFAQPATTQKSQAGQAPARRWSRPTPALIVF